MIEEIKIESPTDSPSGLPPVHCSACPICHDPACMGNECSAPLDEWERGDADEAHVISGACGPVCPYCGAPMGINPSDGNLGCPHPFCCYLGEKPKEAK